MLQFYADAFVSAASFMSMVERLCLDAEDGQTMRKEKVREIHTKSVALANVARHYSLMSIAKQCDRIAAAINQDDFHIDADLLGRLVGELRQRFNDELEDRYFLHLEPKQAAMFEKPTEKWAETITRFSEVEFNIKESGKCFALERYGSAVFHILLVAEYGVIQIANCMNVSSTRPGWGDLEKVQRLLIPKYPQRPPEVQKQSAWLESVVPLATVVKDNWRHKLTHVDNQIVWQDTDFSPEVAEEIVNATRGFMRKLAMELPR
jgi:hypothetical protein